MVSIHEGLTNPLSLLHQCRRDYLDHLKEMMKTKKQFEKQDLSFDEYLKPLDRIDWDLYSYILCGWLAPNFDNGTVGQNGECSHMDFGTMYYSTVMTVNDKYYYLGLLPSFDPSVY